MVDSIDIERGLRSLLGDDVLEKYKAAIVEGWEETKEYWESVEIQAQKDLENLTVLFAFKEGKLGFMLFTAPIESNAEQWIDLDVVVDESCLFHASNKEAALMIVSELRSAADKLEAGIVTEPPPETTPAPPGTAE